MADNGRSVYTLGTLNLYLPFPNPLTASIKSAFFSFVMRLPAAVTESLVIAAMSERPKMHPCHACEYCFGFFDCSLVCVQFINRNLNRKIIRSNRNIFIFNHNFICVYFSSIIQVIQRNLK